MIRSSYFLKSQTRSKIRLLTQKESWIEALRDYRSGKRAAPGSEEKSKINVINSPGAIISQNQTGGQIAHKIINQKPDRRTFKPHRNLITSFLKKAPPCPFEIHILMNDLEVADLAKELIEIFDEAGWKDGFVVKGLGGYYPPGVTVTRDQESKQSDNILEAIFRTGFKNVTGAERKILAKSESISAPTPTITGNNQSYNQQSTFKQFKILPNSILGRNKQLPDIYIQQPRNLIKSLNRRLHIICTPA
jgi:hypothetical protein